jgi:hypothetical protein
LAILRRHAFDSTRTAASVPTEPIVFRRGACVLSPKCTLLWLLATALASFRKNFSSPQTLSKKELAAITTWPDSEILPRRPPSPNDHRVAQWQTLWRQQRLPHLINSVANFVV